MGMNPLGLHFVCDTADTRIRLNQEIQIRIRDHFWLRQPKFKGLGVLGVYALSQVGCK